MMITLNKMSINYLPFHDSDFLGIKIIQSENGQTNLILEILFCKDELDSIDEDYLNIIGPDGTASLLFRNCRSINFHTICNRSQRDEIDYVHFIDDVHNPEDKYKHIKVVFISGSILKCTAEELLIT